MIKIKIFTSYGLDTYEPYVRCNDLTKDDDYGIKYLFTDDNDYTHAFIINTAMPYLSIPKENVVGFAFEPTNFLGLTEKFKDYAKKHIGVYYVGDLGDLGAPFREGYGYMFHCGQGNPVKNKIMSLMISDKVSAPGHIYRHQLATAIIEGNLPIDIYGKGCKYYVSHPRIKGAFASTELYDEYFFTIAIENFQQSYYISEKVINPIMRGTIPVYLGCEHINDFISPVIKLSGNLNDDVNLLRDICRSPSKYQSDIDIETVKKTINIKNVISTLVPPSPRIINVPVCFNQIQCYYINMDKDIQRQHELIAEIGDVFPRLTRISGIAHKNGAYGLALSSLKLLQEAEQSDAEYIGIFEDDFQWELPKHECIAQVEDVLSKEFNLVMLSYHIPVVQLSSFERPLARVNNGQTTCGYLLRKSYIPKLREAFLRSRDNLLSGDPSLYAIDQTWKSLQKDPLFYSTIPRLGRQRISYSTIENRMVSYGGGCFMIILGCNKYLHKIAVQKMDNSPFPYRYFIGGATEEYEDIEKGIVYLTCGDHYEDLSMKTYHALLWVRRHYPNLDYVFKTDDDIKINFEKLYNIYTKLDLRSIPYAGKCVPCRAHVSTYHYGKCNDKRNEVPIEVPNCLYCSGGGYFLSRKAIEWCLSDMEQYENHIFEDQSSGIVLNKKGIQPVNIDYTGICEW